MESGTITRNIFGLSRKEAEEISFRATERDYSIITAKEAKLIGKKTGKKFDEFNPDKDTVTSSTEVVKIKIVTALDKGSANDGRGINLQDGLVFGKSYTFEVVSYTNKTPADLSMIKWVLKYHCLKDNSWKEWKVSATGSRITIKMGNKDICGRFLHVKAYINSKESVQFEKFWHHNRFRYFDSKKAYGELTERIDNKKPWKINQSGTSLCGMACIFYAFAKNQPAAYKKFAKELFRTGEATCNSYTAKPSIELLEKKVNTRGFPMNTSDMPLIDYVTMAGTRNTDSPSYKGGDEEFQAINWPWVMSNLVKKLLGYSNVIEKGTRNFIHATTGLINVEDKLNELEKYHNEGYTVVLMIDADLINNVWDFKSVDYHWIVYEGGLQIAQPNYRIKKYFEDLIMFDVYTWGTNPKDKRKQVMNAKKGIMEANPDAGYLKSNISINHFNKNFYGYLIFK